MLVLCRGGASAVVFQMWVFGGCGVVIVGSWLRCLTDNGSCFFGGCYGGDGGGGGGGGGAGGGGGLLVVS